MKSGVKKAGYAVLIVLAAAVVLFMLMAHGDEQVSGVVLTDEPVEDITVLDGIKSSKGVHTDGFSGALYATANTEFGRYAVTQIAAVPRAGDLYASIYFIASPQGVEYAARWLRDGQTVYEETQAITSDSRQQAMSFRLEGGLVLPGAYTLEISYAADMEHPIYTQSFTVD